MNIKELCKITETIEPLTLEYETYVSGVTTYMTQTGTDGVKMDGVEIIDLYRYVSMLRRYGDFDQYILRGIMETIISVQPDSSLSNEEIESMLVMMLDPLFNQHGSIETLTQELIDFAINLTPVLADIVKNKDMLGWQHSYRLIVVSDAYYYDQDVIFY